MAYTPDAHLVFKDPATKTTAKLVFGEYDTPTSATAQVSLTLKLDPVRILGSVGYDNNVFRDPSPINAVPFQAAATQSLDAAEPLYASARQAQEIAEALTTADAISAEHKASLWHALPVAGWAGDLLGIAVDLAAESALPLQYGTPLVNLTSTAFTAADALAQQVVLPLQWGIHVAVGLSAGFTPANPLRSVLSHPFNQAVVLCVDRDSAMQLGQQPRPGKSWIDPGVNPPQPVCYTPSAKLVFRDTGKIDAHLVFMCDNTLAPGEPAKIVPIRKVYIVLNSVSLIRADTGQPLICEAFDISFDVDSWTCSWSATLAWSEFNALRINKGEPLELLATLNGHQFSLLMEGAPKRQRSFGKWSVSIAGRGIAAWLDDPYASIATYTNASAATAQQIMADALSTNGVSLGWALDWRITDWLVPANTWSFQGTPMAAVLEVANSVGAVVQASHTGKTIKVMPRYANLPWALASANPDIQIPIDIANTDAVEPVIKPSYNAVYVSGQTAGITAYVKRSGSAGDVLAPMVTHALITEAAAARQRGMTILADTGSRESITMSLPLSGDIGLIQVGQLIEVPDPDGTWRGPVRSLALSAKRDDQSGLSIWQTIGLERHYG